MQFIRMKRLMVLLMLVSMSGVTKALPERVQVENHCAVNEGEKTKFYIELRLAPSEMSEAGTEEGLILFKGSESQVIIKDSEKVFMARVSLNRGTLYNDGAGNIYLSDQEINVPGLYSSDESDLLPVDNRSDISAQAKVYFFIDHEEEGECKISGYFKNSEGQKIRLR